MEFRTLTLLAVALSVACAALGFDATPGETRARPAPPSFSSGFEHGLRGFNLAGVGDVDPTVTASNASRGRHAGRFELRGHQERSEVIVGGNGGRSTHGALEFEEGDAGWFGFSFNVRQMIWGRIGIHNLIMQFKSEGTGSPEFALQLTDMRGERGFWSSGGASIVDRFLAPVQPRRWYRVLFNYRASSSDDGFFRVFLDGRKIDGRDGINLIVPGKRSAYLKLGLYRDGDRLPGRSVVLFDAVRQGPTRASVASG